MKETTRTKFHKFYKPNNTISEYDSLNLQPKLVLRKRHSNRRSKYNCPSTNRILQHQVLQYKEKQELPLLSTFIFLNITIILVQDNNEFQNLLSRNRNTKNRVLNNNIQHNRSRRQYIHNRILNIPDINNNRILHIILLIPRTTKTNTYTNIIFDNSINLFQPVGILHIPPNTSNIINANSNSILKKIP